MKKSFLKAKPFLLSPQPFLFPLALKGQGTMEDSQETCVSYLLFLLVALWYVPFCTIKLSQGASEGHWPRGPQS